MFKIEKDGKIQNMNYEINNNNKVELSGEILTEPVYTHELYGEGFFEFELGVPRLSEYVDKIPVTISERLLTEQNCHKGAKIGIKGQFRSYNKMVDDKSKLILTVFARSVCDIADDVNPNIIEVSGYVCKEPVYRTTPFNREICDVLLAVNRAYNKSDYLPCIAWGRNARFIKDVKVGERVFVSGRVQSREYQKKLDDGTIVTKTAYEVSVNKIGLESSVFSLLDDEAEPREQQESAL